MSVDVQLLFKLQGTYFYAFGSKITPRVSLSKHNSDRWKRSGPLGFKTTALPWDHTVGYIVGWLRFLREGTTAALNKPNGLAWQILRLAHETLKSTGRTSLRNTC